MLLIQCRCVYTTVYRGVILASVEHRKTFLHVLRLLLESRAGILVILYPHSSQGIPCSIEEKHLFLSCDQEISWAKIHQRERER